MKQKRYLSITWAILAAALYALNAPISKLLLASVPPTMMAAFLYLGAGVGMLAVGAARRAVERMPSERHLSRKDLPYALGMILLDVAAPIFLMLGLATTASANVSLLNNFEIVATSLIAWLFFREAISCRLWLAIALITLSSVVLSIGDAGSLQFSGGSLFVILACVCWGFENNCTRMMSENDPLEVVVLKGFGSGLGALLIALGTGEKWPSPRLIPAILLLGFVSYGLSIFFYVYAQRGLGASLTSAFYAIAPFIGVILSLLVFRELPGPRFFAALAIMAVGTYFAAVLPRQKEREQSS